MHIDYPLRSAFSTLLHRYVQTGHQATELNLFFTTLAKSTTMTDAKAVPQPSAAGPVVPAIPVPGDKKDALSPMIEAFVGKPQMTPAHEPEEDGEHDSEGEGEEEDAEEEDDDEIEDVKKAHAAMGAVVNALTEKYAALKERNKELIWETDRMKHLLFPISRDFKTEIDGLPTDLRIAVKAYQKDSSLPKLILAVTGVDVTKATHSLLESQKASYTTFCKLVDALGEEGALTVIGIRYKHIAPPSPLAELGRELGTDLKTWDHAVEKMAADGFTLEVTLTRLFSAYYPDNIVGRTTLAEQDRHLSDTVRSPTCRAGFFMYMLRKQALSTDKLWDLFP